MQVTEVLAVLVEQVVLEVPADPEIRLVHLRSEKAVPEVTVVQEVLVVPEVMVHQELR